MTRKTDGGKGDRIPGADPAAYAKGYEGIDWNARERGQLVLVDETNGFEVTLCPTHGVRYAKGCTHCAADIDALTENVRYA